VRDIGAEDHGRGAREGFVDPGKHTNSFASSTAKLSINLHADVGDVLVLSFLNMHRLKALRNDAISTLARLLDAKVVLRVLIWKDKEQHLGLRLILITSVVPDVGDHLTAANGLDNHHDRRWSLNNAAVGTVDVDELREKDRSSLLRNTWSTSVIQYRDTPVLKRTGVGCQEFFAVDAPAASASSARVDLRTINN
jgi:hypothetical protein